MDWKNFANWLKIIVGLEVVVAYVIFKLPALDLVTIGLFQYGLFFSVDASLIIGNIAKLWGKGK